MPIVLTHELTPGSYRPDLHQIYNGLDCALTYEIHERLTEFSEPEIYSFARAMQAPLLEIMLRGFAVDHYERDKAISALRGRQAILQATLDTFAIACWDKPLNPNSPKQLQEFFYGVMKLPEVWISQKGERKLSTNREALEKLDIYFHARPIIACILALRDCAKKISVLSTEVDPDGRMRTSYNIAGTETGRLSSSSSSTGTGTNLQNITSELRRVFIADPGQKLCVIDLEQAESREVGFLCGVLFGDWSYLDMIERGDLHTQTCRMIWPNLPWTGDIKADRKIADQNFYRDYSYRDMSKRGGHGSTYLGTPFTMARHLKVPTSLMEHFQSAFFESLPCIPRWHQWTAKTLQTSGVLRTPFGRVRHFFGRTSDMATLREAVAFVPQSSTADRMNLGLWRLWKHLGTKIQLLAQIHDAVIFQYFPEDEDVIIPQALKLIEIELKYENRVFTIPGEAKVGWNWGNRHDESKPIGPRNQFNPDGLIKWKGRDTRVRTPLLQQLL